MKVKKPINIYHLIFIINKTWERAALAENVFNQHFFVTPPPLHGRKSTFEIRGALENPQTQFSASLRLFLDQNWDGAAATMIQNVPKVNKYGGAHDQNVNKYGYM